MPRGIGCLRSGWRGLTGQRSEPGQANCLLQRVPSLSKDRYPFFGCDEVRAARIRDSADKVHHTVHGWTFVSGTKQGPPSGVFSALKVIECVVVVMTGAPIVLD